MQQSDPSQDCKCRLRKIVTCDIFNVAIFAIAIKVTVHLCKHDMSFFTICRMAEPLQKGDSFICPLDKSERYEKGISHVTKERGGNIGSKKCQKYKETP